MFIAGIIIGLMDNIRQSPRGFGDGVSAILFEVQKPRHRSPHAGENFRKPLDPPGSCI